jgi:hypothetical protein
MPIPSEITRLFVKIARENFRLRADIKTLAGILEAAKVYPQSLPQWRELWLQARETPAYQQTANQFSQSLELLEKVANENEVLAILRQFPMSEVVN